MEKAFLLCVVIVLSGCVRHQPMPMKTDYAGQGPMTVVRYWDGPFLKYTNAVLGSPVFGGNHFAKGNGMRLSYDCTLPHFGLLILEEFVERAPKELPQWPEMAVVSEPMEYGYVSIHGFTVVIIAGTQWVGPYSYGHKGYVADATIEIRQPSGTPVFWKSYFFDPGQNGMSRSLEELEADSCKILKKDMAFAAEKAVDDFISALKGD